MKRHLSPRAIAEREWKKLERWCAERGRDGTAFLADDRGELLLFEGRPVLVSVFGRAWAARRLVEELCAAEGVEPPPPGLSSEYAEWPALDTLAELFMSWKTLRWSEVGEHLLERFEDQVEPRATAHRIDNSDRR